MLLSVVVVNWNSRDDLRACLQSLRTQTHRELEVVVVDNGSADGSVEMVRAEFPEVVLLAEGENLGFAEGCNRGIARSRGEWIAMLNNDAVADESWASELARVAESSADDCGMLQSLLLYQQRPNVINSTGIVVNRSGNGADRDGGRPRDDRRDPEPIFCPTAGAAAYRRAMLDALKLSTGWFDADHFMYYEDLDLGWRARLGGWTALYVPTSIVFHKWHGSSARHGRSWLESIWRINRIRTLLKNASTTMLLTSLPSTLVSLPAVAWHGRLKAVKSLFGAIGRGLKARETVEAARKRGRRGIEKEWMGRRR